MLGSRRRAARAAASAPTRALEEADALARAGRPFEAIRFLTDANRARRDATIEHRLLELRHEAFLMIDRSGGLPSWPPSVDDIFADIDGIPEVTRDRLTPEAIRSGILAHGSLIVRGLIDAATTERLAADIECAFDAYDKTVAGEGSSESALWYQPFVPRPGFPMRIRNWVRDGGGVLAVDSPTTFFDIMECFDEVGMPALLESYLGERPALSVKKTTLRKVPPDTNTDWHQDGAFLGAGIRTVNVWATLTPCGVDAPSLDIVARRFENVLETGTDGAHFDWSVGAPAVERAANGAPIVRPVFEAGDAILFDEMCLHRTGAGPGLTHDRSGIEMWFFAPSRYPDDMIPIAF